jgi:hypothetical protein
MALDHLGEYRSVFAACQAIGPTIGGAESLRRWMLQLKSMRANGRARELLSPADQ